MMRKYAVLLAMLGGILFAPPLFAAHVCYAPSAGVFGEDTNSGGRYTIWGVSGVATPTGLWISRDTPVGRTFADSARVILWRAQDKSLSVHIRYNDADGNIWTVSDPMTQALCLQQTP